MTGKSLAGCIHLLLVICIRIAFSPRCAKWRVNGCFPSGDLTSEDVVTLPRSDHKHQRWESKLECVYSSLFWYITCTVSCSSLWLKWLGWILPAWILGRTHTHLSCTGYCPDMLSTPRMSPKCSTWGEEERVHLWPQCITVPSDVCSPRHKELAGHFHLFLTMCCFMELITCWFCLSKE